MHLRGSVSLLSVFQDGILMNHRPGITVPNKARLRICFNASILFLGLEWADSMDDMDVDSWECQFPAVPTPASLGGTILLCPWARACGTSKIAACAVSPPARERCRMHGGTRVFAPESPPLFAKGIAQSMSK